MARIIQFVGIPGSGKSYLLSRYFEIYNPKDFRLWEFGQELSKIIKKEGEEYPQDRYIMDLIGRINNSKLNGIISSHLVHRNVSGEYEWDFKYDRETNAEAYIHIMTPKSLIAYYRMNDNLNRKKIRAENSLEILAEHQKLSIYQTFNIANELRSDFLLINNLRGKELENLEIMHKFFEHYLKIK